jgi:hypothetical protein
VLLLLCKQNYYLIVQLTISKKTFSSLWSNVCRKKYWLKGYCTQMIIGWSTKFEGHSFNEEPCWKYSNVLNPICILKITEWIIHVPHFWDLCFSERYQNYLISAYISIEDKRFRWTWAYVAHLINRPKKKLFTTLIFPIWVLC